jgi:hypothetical protein
MKTPKQILIAVMSGLFSDEKVKEAKTSLLQGRKIKGEITLRIPYELSKGINYEVAPTVNLLSQAVLAKAIVYSGVTAAAYKTGLTLAVKEALENGKNVSEQLKAEDTRILKTIKDIQEEIVKQLPKQPRSGMTKVKLLTEDGLPIIISEIIEGV